MPPPPEKTKPSAAASVSSRPTWVGGTISARPPARSTARTYDDGTSTASTFEAPQAAGLSCAVIPISGFEPLLAKAENELGVVGHLLRRPGWIPGQLGLDLLDAGQRVGDLLDLLLDHRANRAPHRGQREKDVHLRAIDFHVVHEPEVDDVHPQFGILDLAQCLHNIIPRRHPRAA